MYEYQNVVELLVEMTSNNLLVGLRYGLFLGGALFATTLTLSLALKHGIRSMT